MEKRPVTRQNSDEIDKFLEGAASFADMMFGFLDESDDSDQGNLRDYGDENANDDEVLPRQIEKNRVFWEAQQQLLQVIKFSPIFKHKKTCIRRNLNIG